MGRHQVECSGGKKAIVVFVPVPQLKAFQKIQTRLVRQQDLGPPHLTLPWHTSTRPSPTYLTSPRLIPDNPTSPHPLTPATGEGAGEEVLGEARSVRGPAEDPRQAHQEGQQAQAEEAQVGGWFKLDK